MDKKQVIKLLENKMYSIIRQTLLENERGDDNMENSEEYKRKYKSIQKTLSDPSVNVTQIFVKAGIIKSADDDAGRSHAFKQLHQEKTQDGTGVYKFSNGQITAIENAIGS